MKSLEKYEHAQFIIGRYDHYNDSVNNKGTFFITLNTFLLGGLFAGFLALHNDLVISKWLWFWLITFGACSIASSVLTIIAINPFLVSGNKDKQKRSLIFFGSVSEYQKDNFFEAFQQQDEARILSDTITQTWLLAKGLTSKYYKLKWAGRLMIFQFILLIPIIYLITEKLLK